MSTALTIVQDSAGVQTCIYCGEDTSAALDALMAAESAGKYVSGFVTANPRILKRREFPVAAAPPPAPEESPPPAKPKKPSA